MHAANGRLYDQSSGAGEPALGGNGVCGGDITQPSQRVVRCRSSHGRAWPVGRSGRKRRTEAMINGTIAYRPIKHTMATCPASGVLRANQLPAAGALGSSEEPSAADRIQYTTGWGSGNPA